jgi:predicted O-methyltransferase YrrM
MNLEPFIKSGRVVPVRGLSQDVSSAWDQEIDFLFVDGDHRTKSVIRDLVQWVPKVRSGGLVVGDDWEKPWGKRVRPAVRKAFTTILKKTYSVDKLYYASDGALKKCYWGIV